MNRYKKIMAIFSVVVFFFNSVYSYDIYGYANNGIYTEYIPEEAYEYAEKNYQIALKVVLNQEDLYGITGSLDEFKLCEPYVVYDVEKGTQDPLFYFPISDNNDNIVLVMAVFYTEDGWSNSIGKDISEELNLSNYLNEECLIYGDDNDICIENKDTKIQDDKIDGGELEKFSSKSFLQKKKEFNKNYEVDFDVKYEEADLTRNIDESGFKVSSKTSVLLDTDNAVVDQKINGSQRGICWAATIATIYNYIKDRKITAKDVCTEINHSYSGGSLDDIECAICVYNLNYVYRGEVLDYDRIRRYLLARKPIYMRTITADSSYRHAVTLVGHSRYKDSRYISVWNSAKEKYEALEYRNEDTSFGMGGRVYHWESMFCFK